jgi:hypothetical protein
MASPLDARDLGWILELVRDAEGVPDQMAPDCSSEAIVQFHGSPSFTRYSDTNRSRIRITMANGIDEAG